MFQIQRGGWWKEKKEEDEDRLEVEEEERWKKMEMGGRFSKSDPF